MFYNIRELMFLIIFIPKKGMIIKMERVILHIDMNNCYASIECKLNPELKDKCVAVAGSTEDRHGIILAKNEKAKSFGVMTGEAIWQAKKKCPELITVPPRYNEYIKHSKAARRIYSDYTDKIEPFGIDECWIDITGLWRRGKQADGKEIADEIRRRIKESLGITVSVGVSFNKIFAKLGSDMKKPDAVTVITPEGKDGFKEKVFPLDVGELLYVGKATKKKLNSKGIFTIGELAQTSPALLKSWLGKWGEYLWIYANGLDRTPVESDGHRPLAKSVSNGTTAYRDLENDNDVKITVFALAENIASRLRAINSKCETVSVSIKNKMLYTYSRQTKLAFPTDDAYVIASAALSLYKKSYNWAAGNPIRAISVCAAELVDSESDYQTSIFEQSNENKKHEALNKTIDVLRNKYGYQTIRRAITICDNRISGFNSITQENKSCRISGLADSSVSAR